ncbi:MAG: M15 family metallopeptidase [Anaerococcus sp.]|nr:M15 family metallopeptidase [Anaerococcus sp.]
MSNKGLRELKRRKLREARKRRKRILAGGIALVGVFSVGYFINADDDDFTIGRPTEYRQALGASETNDKQKQEPQGEFTDKATKAGFADVEVSEGMEIEDTEYSDTLVSYIRAICDQEAFQYPNDYSKTDKSIREGSYLPFYGCQNGYAKIKIDDSFYYVNKYGLEKLSAEASVKVINGIAYVNSDYTLPQDFNPGLDKTAYKAFETMRQDMQRQGLDLKIASDYRDFDLETRLYEAGDVDSDVPGTSEHQLGDAFDFFTGTIKYDDKFTSSKEYNWLKENSYKYGFIERYPADKENITNHRSLPWHFRFVGVYNAKVIYDNDLTLEEYLKIN